MNFLRNLGLAALLILGVWLALLYGRAQDPREQIIPQKNQRVIILDGDSFRIGTQEFRIEGIDAPEYRQRCTDKAGAPWDCGKASRASLQAILQSSGLSCESRVRDGFGRRLAICKNEGAADIGAAQVAAGMAVSDKFNGIRSYPSEEDAAKGAARGIWQGSFLHPREWRDAHPRNRPDEPANGAKAAKSQAAAENNEKASSTAGTKSTDNLASQP